MFGMGFTEILFIAVIAILFLGPEKLPDAMVQIAKFFKSVRGTINEAKSSFEEEIHIKELREEALGYRRKIEEASRDIRGFKNAIPNPAAELQDAITSIGSDRYLDEDLLDDIHEAERLEAELDDTPHASDTPAQTTPRKTASPKTASHETASKDAPPQTEPAQTASAPRPTQFKHLSDQRNG